MFLLKQIIVTSVLFFSLFSFSVVKAEESLLCLLVWEEFIPVGNNFYYKYPLIRLPKEIHYAYPPMLATKVVNLRSLLIGSDFDGKVMNPMIFCEDSPIYEAAIKALMHKGQVTLKQKRDLEIKYFIQNLEKGNKKQNIKLEGNKKKKYKKKKGGDCLEIFIS